MLSHHKNLKLVLILFGIRRVNIYLPLQALKTSVCSVIAIVFFHEMNLNVMKISDSVNKVVTPTQP